MGDTTRFMDNNITHVGIYVITLTCKVYAAIVARRLVLFLHETSSRPHIDHGMLGYFRILTRFTWDETRTS